MLLTACATTGGDRDQGRAPLRPLSCIAVLPAEAAFDKDVQWSAEQRRSLAEGAAFATEVTSRQLDGNPKVRLVTPVRQRRSAPNSPTGCSAWSQRSVVR